jgi:hypothetical protein
MDHIINNNNSNNNNNISRDDSSIPSLSSIRELPAEIPRRRRERIITSYQLPVYRELPGGPPYIDIQSQSSPTSVLTEFTLDEEGSPYQEPEPEPENTIVYEHESKEEY